MNKRIKIKRTQNRQDKWYTKIKKIYNIKLRESIIRKKINNRSDQDEVIKGNEGRRSCLSWTR